MRAVRLERPGQFSMMNMDPPAGPGRGQASALVRRIGICGTDFHAFQGNQPYFQYPRILGHELALEVVAVGENDRGLAVGDLCALEPYFNCGRCPACLRGKSNCCVSVQVFGVHIDGGMREQVTVPVSKLHKSSTLSLDQLALVEPLSIGAHAVDRAAPDAGDSVLIIGVGPIGLSVAQSARQLDVKIVATDINETRLEFCRKMLGIEDCIDAKSDTLSQLHHRLDGHPPSIVFDCTGNPRSMQNAFSYVAHGGKLVFVGLFVGDVTFNDPDFHSRETTLLSSRNATEKDFRRIIQGMEAGKIDVKPWITHRISSATFPDRFPQFAKAESGVLKALVEW